MTPDAFFARMHGHGPSMALATPARVLSYNALSDAITEWRARFRGDGVAVGDCIAFNAAFTPASVSVFLALVAERCVAVPLCFSERDGHDRMCRMACVSAEYRIAEDGATDFWRREGGDHPLLQTLRGRGEPGVVLFSSGSTGTPKAVLLSISRLLSRYASPRAPLRTLAFLSFNHIGGVNTLLHTFSNGGAAVVPCDRTADAVCEAIERHRVELLPTTPTFLNLLLMSGALARHDLSSLQLITYGTECMPEATLAALSGALPNVRLKQTYGSTELGILPTQSESSRSRWVRVAGRDCEVRLVHGTVQIRAPWRMEGYLNAPQPFDADGWYDTGDVAEEHDGYLRIAGRKSDIINVGGEKVFPAEVESVLLQMPNVVDAVVEGRHNAVMGQVVTARVNLETPELRDGFETRMRRFCSSRLAEFKLPVFVEVTAEPLWSARFKRQRSPAVER